MADWTIEWLDEAVEDKNKIVFYIARRDPVAAFGIDEEFDKQVGALASFPGMGRVGRIPGSRELLMNPLHYIVVYELNTVDEIVTILHIYDDRQSGPRFIRIR